MKSILARFRSRSRSEKIRICRRETNPASDNVAVVFAVAVAETAASWISFAVAVAAAVEGGTGGDWRADYQPPTWHSC